MAQKEPNMLREENEAGPTDSKRLWLFHCRSSRRGAFRSTASGAAADLVLDLTSVGMAVVRGFPLDVEAANIDPLTAPAT